MKTIKKRLAIVLVCIVCMILFSHHYMRYSVLRRKTSDWSQFRSTQGIIEHVTFARRTTARYKIHTKRGLIEDSKKGYLLYTCKRRCGGWADRLKGIVTGYILANITDRKFGIDITNLPCELTKAVIPNQFNWNLKLTGKQFLKMPTMTYSKIDDNNFLKNVPYIDFRKEFPAHKKLIKFTANLDYIDQFKQNKFHEKDLNWLRNMPSYQAYIKILKFLLKLSPESQSIVDGFMNRVKPDQQTKLICAHIRRGKSATIPSDPVRANDKDVQNAWKFLSAYNDSSIHKIFIATDSEAVIREGKTLFAKQIVENVGNIIHVDRNDNQRVETCDDFRKVISDQQILSRCDVLLISNSGFSRYAAYMRNTDEGLFCILKNHSGIVRCEQGHIINIYGVVL